MNPRVAAARDLLLALLRRLAAPAGILIFIVIIQLVASFSPQLVEQYYSRGLYPRVLNVAAVLGRLSSYSVAEVLLLVSLAGLLAWLTWQAHNFFAQRRKARAVLAPAFAQLCWMAAALAALFMLAFGLNYQRPPLAETLRFEQREPDAREAEWMSRAIVEGINQNYAESGADAALERGSRLPLTRPELFAVLEESFAREPLLSGMSAADSSPVPPKPVYFSGLMSRLGVSGVYSLFTAEPNYNAIQPDASLPFTVAHEMAHQRGLAREAEASFVAFLVCIKSTHPYIRYSGYLNALRVLSVLRRLAPEQHREVAALLGDGPRADLRANDAFWARYGGNLNNMARRVNDAYLKANRVRSGVRNYGEVTALIIGYYLKESLPATAVADSAARSYP